jgi:uncharacterized protein
MEELSTSIYSCKVFHGRISPVNHTFIYSYFMFLLDLDDNKTLKDLRLTGHESAAVYSFRSSDHYHDGQLNTRDSVLKFISANEVDVKGCKLFLLTNLRTLGHQFNPVSFYFLTNKESIIACVAEVGNTFKEQKLFFIPKENEKFYLRVPKHFYVSPFSKLDAEFEFNIGDLSKGLDIRINTIEQGKVVLYSRLEGKREALSDKALIKYTVRFPLVTLKVITMIHWQAMKLWLKKTPFIRKNHDPELEKNHYKLTR